MLALWIIVFIISLIILVKGADWLLVSAEKIGLALGLSSFIVGVVIVGLGTSFPELISSIMALLKGVTEIISANAIGSNIANILLVVGLSAVVGGRLVVSKNLIDLDLPLLAVTTALFGLVAWDGVIYIRESILLIVLFIIYLVYTIVHKDDTEEREETLPARSDRRKLQTSKPGAISRPKLVWKDFALLVIGIAFLVLGAKYLIDSVIKLSEILAIAPGVISLAAVALGTSLPELMVSLKAAWQKKSELALGNIFGSNVFNILFVVGFPGMFKTLHLDQSTLTLGLPVMIIATLLFITSGISRRIHVYEGAMYLVIYIFFIGRLFNFI